MKWTEHAIKAMSTEALFCTLAIHKGLIADKTVIRNAGTAREIACVFHYYYLGVDDLIGVDDTFSRRVFGRNQKFDGAEHFDLIDTSPERFSPRNKWEGPAESPRWAVQTANVMKADARFACDVLNNKRKPKLGFKLKTKSKPTLKPTLKYEDRPDVGRHLIWHAESEAYMETSSPEQVAQYLEDGCDDVTGMPKHEAKAKLYFEEHRKPTKPKLKLYPKQQELFDAPMKFKLKGGARPWKIRP